MNNNKLSNTNQARRRRSKRRGFPSVSAMVRADAIANPSPPTFNASHKYFKRMRFLCTEAVIRYPIMSNDIATLMVVVLSSAGAGAYNTAPIWSKVRLVAVEMWATASAITTPSNLTLSFTDPASGTGTNSEHTASDIAKSVDQYAHVKLKPKPASTSALWQNETTTGMGFELTCPQGTILDLTLEVYLNNDDAYITKLSSFSNTPTVGRLYCDFLDPSSGGTSPGKFQPVSYANSEGAVPTPRV